MDNAHLIVGLGNPGADYTRTRHNAGFMAAERLACGLRASWGFEKKFNARVAFGQAEGRRVILCQPQTYMNASGEAVGKVAAFYGIGTDQTLVIVDDADLPLGQIRLRPGGGNGGHHGLESIEQHLGTNGYARLRIGIGRRDGAREITGHVLGKFSPEEMPVLEKVLMAACNQATTWVQSGIQKAMNQFNGVVAGLDEGNKQ